MYNPRYFTLFELCYSYTAEREGINNIPNFYQVSNLSRLCELILDPVREKIRQPIVVTSGYRSYELNKAIGGAPSSQHLLGCAADIVCADMASLEKALKESNYDQLILEKSNNGKSVWYHVSIPTPNAKPRQEFLTITNNNHE